MDSGDSMTASSQRGGQTVSNPYDSWNQEDSQFDWQVLKNQLYPNEDLSFTQTETESSAVPLQTSLIKNSYPSQKHIWLKRIFWIGFPVVLLFLGFCILLSKHLNQYGALDESSAMSTAESSPTSAMMARPDEVNPLMKIDVTGDVRHPGVYSLPSSARVEDAVKAAGGFLHPQDSSMLNLAEQLSDGEEVFVPAPNGQGFAGQPSTAFVGNAQIRVQSMDNSTVAIHTSHKKIALPENPVDLNTASAASLETVPGIGPTRAQRIIAYRQLHGGFKNVSDLKNIKGIGEKTYEKIAEFFNVQ